ncbi:MAG: flagellar basal body protein, partial [Oscillospiraceae bacterium]|nr:flagellar basal body protein [Oscillospiraceae bacterium]
MNISFHTGKTAMIAQAKALNVYGNNIANVNTVGYQTLRPDFADCIYETERRPEADWQTGHGTYIQKTDLMFAESFFNETDRPQDMAIAG